MGERGNRLNRLLDRYAGIPLAAAAACLRAGSPRAVERADRVGLLCVGAIGDLLLLSCLARGLRRILPRARIELVVSAANAGAAALVPGIDEYAAFAVRQVFAMVRHIRSRAYDILFDSSQWARYGALISNLSGAAVTVGFDTPGQWRALGYTCRVPHRGDRHEVENFLALGRALWPDLSGEPGIVLPADPPQEAVRLMAAPGKKAFLHMWPSGYKAFLKEWPAEHWAALARHLLDSGFVVLLTGGPGDAERNDVFLKEHFAGCGGVVSLAGRMSLPGIAWMLSHADAVVSVNTGTMHLAALAGAPTVGLHGATNPLRWGPVGPRTVSLLPDCGQRAYLNLGFEYPPDARPSLQAISVDDVLAALRSLGALPAAG